MTQRDYPALHAGSDLLRGRRDATPVGAVASIWLYSILNRLVPDTLVVPGPVSITPSQVMLFAFGAVWVYKWGRLPSSVPSGVVGASGVAVLAVASIGPLANAASMSDSEFRLFDQGVVLAFGYTLLLLAAYQVGQTRGADAAIAGVIAVAAIQGMIGIYESASGVPMRLVSEIWQSVGLQLDPRSGRGVPTELNTRLTGETRVFATAPHPLVLSATLALGALVSMSAALGTRGWRRVAWTLACVVQLGGVAATNSRTGVLLLAVGTVMIAVRHASDVRALLALLGGVGVAVVAVAVARPETAELAFGFFTGAAPDHNYEVRVDQYAYFPELFNDGLLIGPGYKTLDSSVILFDNSYLAEAVGLGLVGVGMLVLFLASAAWRSLAHWASGPPGRLAPAAGALAGMCVLLGAVAFDAWGFDQFMPMALILLGIGVGAADASLPRPHR